jgi:hypothetical protein
MLRVPIWTEKEIDRYDSLLTLTERAYAAATTESDRALLREYSDRIWRRIDALEGNES